MNRASVETVLIKRCALALEMVGLDSTTISGTNADLNDPIWTALRRVGYSVVNISSVSDADVAQVTGDYERVVIDLAELRVLETCMNRATSLVDVSIGPRRESLSQFSDRLEKRIAQKQAQIVKEYGDLFGTGLEAGTFSVSSVEDGTNEY